MKKRELPGYRQGESVLRYKGKRQKNKHKVRNRNEISKEERKLRHNNFSRVQFEQILNLTTATQTQHIKIRGNASRSFRENKSLQNNIY